MKPWPVLLCPAAAPCQLKGDDTFSRLQEVVDLYGFLLRNRIVFINRRISDEVRWLPPCAPSQPRPGRARDIAVQHT